MYMTLLSCDILVYSPRHVLQKYNVAWPILIFSYAMYVWYLDILLNQGIPCKKSNFGN